MIYEVVVDTNVLVSALISNHTDAATVQLLNHILCGNLTLIYSKEIMCEYREVLRRKKFKFDQEKINDLLTMLEKYGILVEPSPTAMLLTDKKDLPFYEAAMEKQQEGAYLVTGNLKHFPKEPFIVTARQMINLFNEKR